MKNTSAKRAPAPKAVTAAKPVTMQGVFDKWGLPVLFVVIGAVIVWTFVNAYMTHPK